MVNQKPCFTASEEMQNIQRTLKDMYMVDRVVCALISTHRLVVVVGDRYSVVV